jgi:amidase
MTVELSTPNRASNLPADLWRWSAADLARGIRSGSISSRDAVESCLARIEQVNPVLNALAEVTPDEARAMAEAADKAVATGEPLGPLHGVPVSVKVNTAQKGHATTHGVVAYKDDIATADDPQVAKLREAGAVFVGRGNSPAFSWRWFTNNDLHGQTLNPWDSARTPGGSSGGAASTVASGMLPIAHGNDIGGSIRYPAYASGVFGLRPSVGRVPHWFGPQDGDMGIAMQSYGVDGPLARTVADLRIALDGMSGYDPRDPASLDIPFASQNQPLGRPVRVGLLRDVGVATPVPAVQEALDQAAGWLSDAGYVVEEIELPLLAEAYRLWYLLGMEEFRTFMDEVSEIGDHGMRQSAANQYATAAEWWGTAPDLAAFQTGYARRGTLISQLQMFMEDYPLVLLPVSAELPFLQDADISSPERMREMIAAQWSMMAIPLVSLPALSVPTGVADGLPVGVQLMSRKFREDALFDAAEVIEARSPSMTPIDPR